MTSSKWPQKSAHATAVAKNLPARGNGASIMCGKVASIMGGKAARATVD
jgi:hypothetical protein